MMPYLAKSLSSMSPKASHGHTTVMSVPRPSMPGMSSPKLPSHEQKAIRISTLAGVFSNVDGCKQFGNIYPFWPGLGALLLNVRVCLCLNLGGPFLGVVGPVAPPGDRALPAGGLAFISEGKIKGGCYFKHLPSGVRSNPVSIKLLMPISADSTD